MRQYINFNKVNMNNFVFAHIEDKRYIGMYKIQLKSDPDNQALKSEIAYCLKRLRERSQQYYQCFRKPFHLKYRLNTVSKNGKSSIS